MATTTGIAVVGASLGGLRAAEQLRAAGWAGGITVFGDEPHPPYNRPPLSKEVLAGSADPSSTELRRRPSTADVTWRTGTAVASADLAARRLTRPGPGGRRHVVRTLDDAAALRAALRPGARVVVVGAGFIGCEVAATARRSGCEVTVVAPERAPMLRPLGEFLAGVLRGRHEAEGARFVLGRTVDRFSGSGPVLDDGTQLVADCVVEAVGSVPNTSWLEGNGLDLGDGVLCDGGLRIEGAPHAVAVGDIARFPNARYGAEARRVEHWSMPGDTARHAARTLVGGLTETDAGQGPFAPLPSFWSDQFGMRLQSFGAPGLAGEDGIELLQGDSDAHPEEHGGDLVVGYRRRGGAKGGLSGDAGQLVGVVALGGAKAAAAAGQYRAELLAGLRPLS